MPARILLLNPRRKAKRNPRHKHRATHRNPKRVTRRKINRNPKRRRSFAGYIVGSKSIRRRKLNPRRVHHSPLSIKNFSHELMPVGLGAAGGIGIDVLYGYLGQHIPATISGNVYLSAALKLAAAYGLGIAAEKTIGRSKGSAVQLGAMTVVAYGAIKTILASMTPNIPGLSGMGAYMPMGAYMQNALPPPNAGMNGFGDYNPAPYLQGLGNDTGLASDSMF